MTNIEEILKARKASLVSEVAELSKKRFFAIRSLGYCIGFTRETIRNLDTDKFVDSLHYNGDIPPEWLALKSYDLISEKFDGFDVIEEMPKTTRLNNFMRSQMFIALMAELEDYLNQVLEIVLLAYPEKLQSSKLDVVETLEKPNAVEVIEEEAAKIIKNLKGGRQLFDFIKSTLDENKTLNLLKQIDKVDENQQQDVSEMSIESLFTDFEEMKLRRNKGLHNGWIRDKTYDKKVSEQGCKLYEGDFLSIDQKYFNYASEIAINILTRCNALCKLGFSGDVTTK